MELYVPRATLNKLNPRYVGGQTALLSARSLRIGFGDQVDDRGMCLRKISKYRSACIRA